MSSPERELPPLRVKILGDNSSFKKAHDEAIAMAKSMDEHVKKVTRGAGGVGADKETVRRIKGMNKAYANQVKQDNAAIKAKIDGENAKFNREFQNEVLLDKQRRAKERADRQARISRLREMGSDLRQNLKNDEASMAATRRKERADRQARISRLREMGSDLRQNLKNDEASMAATRRKERADRQAYVSRLRSLGNELRQRSRNELADIKATQRRERLSERWLKTETKAIERADKARQKAHEREMARHARERQAQSKASWGKVSSSWQRMVGRGSNAASGFNNGLSSRADIYMHQRGIQHLVGYVSGLAAIGTEFQNMEIKIGAFTNSAQEAKKAMADLKEESITSPHSIKELGDATTKMLGYGLSMQQTVDVRKRLQDVAGGDDETFSKLARGISQIVTLGKLQGDEMNQLAEHGFNPLATMARHMTKGMGPDAMIKKYKELDAAKRAGKITSDMVLAALRLETSAGGHFAGLSDKLAQGVSGLSKQIKNVALLIGDLGFNAIKDDLEGVLRYILANIKAWREWAVNNKEAVKEIAKNAIALIGAVAAFHLAGFAIALISWNLRTLRGLLVLLMPLQWAWSIITGACAAAMFLWTTATTGWIGATAVAIGLILGLPIAIGAIALAIHNMRNGISLAGWDLKRFAELAEGFFWNIGHNSKILTDYIKHNFDALTKYLTDVFAGMFSALPKNLMVALRVGSELMRVWADSQGKMVQFYMGVAIDKTVADRFRTPAMIEKHDADIVAAGIRLQSKLNAGMENTYNKLMEKESKNLKTGLEGVKYEGKAIEGLKFDTPDWANFPKGEPKPLPPAEDPDFMKMMGASKGGNKGGLTLAPAYQSGEHAKQIYADTERMQARAAGTPKKEDKQAEANRILKAIERNTRAGETEGNKFLIETALGGVNQ